MKLAIETSHSIVQVAKELDINADTQSNWVQAYRHDHAEEELLVLDPTAES